MSDSTNEPQWNLLPRDAVRFFGLAEGFDRKDLKRAYNRLLRIYKPEKFPAEFQKIRAAYEQLDEELRYHGGTTIRRVPVPQDWRTDDDATGRAASSDREVQPPAKLAERLKSESPATLFEELKQRDHKTPFDYYALAVLSDVVEKSPTGFAKWLVEGVAAHRSDGALKQLLHDYLRSANSGKLLLKLLPAVARAVRSDEFYPLTEPAWQTVLDECEFHKFADAYDRCEAELRDSHIVGRMAFLIHMLKTALWRDSEVDGWSARQFAFVEENFESIPPWLEWDVEILSIAREYLAIRQQFVGQSPLRGRLDAALEAYFTKSQEEGDRAIVAAELELLAAGDDLMREFPLEDGEVLTKFYPIWAWASHDVGERQAVKPEEEIQQEIWARRAAVLLDRMEKECNNSITGVVWGTSLAARSLSAIPLVVGAVLIPPAAILGVFLILPESMRPAVVAIMGFVAAIGLSILSLVAVLFTLKPKLDQLVWFPLNERFARKCYDRIWRRELMDYQRRSHVPDSFFRAVFNHFADKTATASWVNQFVQQDYAPAMLAGAQRYQA